LSIENELLKKKFVIKETRKVFETLSGLRGQVKLMKKVVYSEVPLVLPIVESAQNHCHEGESMYPDEPRGTKASSLPA
jgi:hypothetical protein